MERTDLPDFRCPVCETLSGMVLNVNQAFCTDDACHVLMFNPSSPDGGMSNTKVVDLSPLAEFDRRLKGDAES